MRGVTASGRRTHSVPPAAAAADDDAAADAATAAAAADTAAAAAAAAAAAPAPAHALAAAAATAASAADATANAAAPAPTPAHAPAPAPAPAAATDSADISDAMLKSGDDAGVLMPCAQGFIEGRVYTDSACHGRHPSANPRSRIQTWFLLVHAEMSLTTRSASLYSKKLEGSVVQYLIL